MKVLVGILVVLAIFYGIFRGAMAASEWLTLSNIVGDVVPIQLPQRADDGWSDENAGTVRAAIVREADKNGITLDPSTVSVTEESGTVSVRLSYAYPFVAFRDQTVVTVPLNVSRSFALPR